MKEGAVIKIIKNKKVIGICYYDYIVSTKDILEKARDILNNYNANIIEEVADNYRLCMYMFKETRVNIKGAIAQAKLLEKSKSALSRLFDNIEINEEYADKFGLIAIAKSDITEIMKKDIIELTINLDDNFLHGPLYRKASLEEKEKISNIEDLKIFDYKFTHFAIYEIEEILDFIEKNPIGYVLSEREEQDIYLWWN